MNIWEYELGEYIREYIWAVVCDIVPPPPPLDASFMATKRCASFFLIYGIHK